MARASGLKLQAFAESSGYPVYHLQTRAQNDRGLYVSAGIHGDEPAGCAGLIHWAEKRLAGLVRQGLSLFLLPCLNPWGLVNNRRSDEEGNDLNRLFDRGDLSPVSELKRLLEPRHFALAIHLHEDYDAQGNYLYELLKEPLPWGPELLAGCRRAIPVEPRRRIEGRSFQYGCFVRRQPRSVPGHPEALHLFPTHCPRALTFETPSELALPRRVQAQFLLLEGCVRRFWHPPSPPG